METSKTISSPTTPKTDGVKAKASLHLLPYLLAGTLFGIISVKSEIISWYRIQEMFRFDSFHMYGIIGSAVVVAAVSIGLIKRFGIKSADAQAITIPAKEKSVPRYLIGGTLFGLGWALTGACPGPILALIGAGLPAFIIVLVGALLGTYSYGALRSKLPH